MNWITASFLMFLFSVLTYLGVRKNTLLGTPPQINNLAMMLIPALVYGAAITLSSDIFLLTPYQFLVVTVLGIFLAYLGNRFSMQSIDRAPNPGYSLVISKSYVIFTTLVAIWAFDAELTLKTGLAILLIIGFSPLVIISSSSKKADAKKSWFLLSLGAFFCWGMLSLTSKYLLLIGVEIVPRLFWSTLLASLLILSEIKKEQINIKSLTRKQFLVFLVIGVGSVLFNYFMQLGFDVAPNIGYVNAINAASIAVLTVCSALLFKDELTARKLIGVSGIITGLIILVI